ncbi:LysR family transcriptional regulator [Subtercola frigoramans]|uniref:DNA-binding transcriptional LysR family regulator n=1 Tax=Subtercola frigoramans TaxID=120298 RepID=A0ABS2L8V4_9MICO|nr:LysR family transcriptional regulator [Subtercola frigoramans]MBM7473504.1 DNA-binding transcriptional LysR family regulator [Subtercola frigoramans]
MESRQLEYFLAVADELNFTRAAQALFAVQSTVSAGIKALELELGCTLFVRSTRNVELTPVGESLVPEARAALEAIARVRTTAGAVGSGLRGRLRVGIFTNLEVIDFPRLLAEFRAEHPLVELSLTASPAGSTGLADDVRFGRIDVALMGLPASELRGLTLTSLVRTRFSAVVPLGHPLAGEPSVTLERLSQELFVDTPRGFGNRVILDRAFEARGLVRRVTTEVGEISAVEGFVAAGLGIAVLPDGITSPREGTVIVPLAGEPIEWELSLARRATPRPSPAVAAFLDLATKRPTYRLDEATGRD